MIDKAMCTIIKIYWNNLPTCWDLKDSRLSYEALNQRWSFDFDPKRT